MSNVSWRIDVELNDRSQKTIVTAPSGTGATIVASKQSVEKPVLFGKNDTLRILNMFGVPDYAEQGLLEAIQFNKSYPIWISSPAKILKRKYLLLGAIITIPNDYLIGSLDDFNPNNFSAGFDFTKSTEEGKKIIKDLNIADCIEKSKDGFKVYCDEDPTIQLGFYIDEEIDPSTGHLITKYNIRDDESSESESGITGTWELKLNTDELTCSINSSDDRTFYLSFSKKVGATDIGVIAQRGVGNFVKSIIFTKKDGAYVGTQMIPYLEMVVKTRNYLGKEQVISTSKFTYEPDGKDSYGNSYNLKNVFLNNDYFEAKYLVDDIGDVTTDAMIVNYQYPLPENPTPSQIRESRTYTFANFGGTKRSELPNGVDFDKAFEYYKKSKVYSMDVLFDAINASDSVIRTKIFDGYSMLRGGVGGAEDPRNAYQPYVRVLLPMQSTDAKEDSTTGLYEEMKSVPRGRGYSVYAGKFKVTNAYSPKHSEFECVPMGSIAKNHSDSIVISKGGYAVAWVNENGVGGQLNDSRVFDLATNQTEWSESELKMIDQHCINPVVFDDLYGAMIVSRRTTFDGYSDYSFNDYSGIMDYIIKNVIKNALPYQLIKKNDLPHREMVKSKCEEIIRPLYIYPLNLISTYKVKCDEENNDEIALANEEFHLDIAVKMTPKSETIHLTFTNVGQTMSVEEVI